MAAEQMMFVGGLIVAGAGAILAAVWAAVYVARKRRLKAVFAAEYGEAEE